LRDDDIVNHLAHLFLAQSGGAAGSQPADRSISGGLRARRSTELLIGNLSGDFVKGVLGDDIPPAIRAGIVMHRRIDAYTDAHPQVGEFRRLIAAEQGHYARVIADIFIDHFLACRFDEYAGEPLEAFLVRTFAALDPHARTFPGMLRVVYPRMRDGEWLQSYRTLDGIRTALTNISWRFSRRPKLGPATHLLVDARPELERWFEQFFPDVVEHAKSLLGACE
jgi:acyl carrier protein phosphodiesterase